MSSLATPIPPDRFAEAILDLPLLTLHFKAAEIRNSISHLESSNSQLQGFADECDRDCIEALKENEETMLRMEERIMLLRREVERRGFEWGEDVDMRGPDLQARLTGHEEGGRGTEVSEDARQSTSAVGEVAQPPRSTIRTLGDEELAGRPRERMDGDGEGDGDGIHL